MLIKSLDIDKNPKLITFTQKTWGKITLAFIYAIILSFINIYPMHWKEIIIITIFLTSFIPQYRYLWIFIGMMCLLVDGSLIKYEPDWLLFKANYFFHALENGYGKDAHPVFIKYIDILLTLIISESIIFFTRNFQRLNLMHFPITISYIFIFILIIVANQGSLTHINTLYLWSFIIVYNHYFWFTGYTMLESRMHTKRNYLLDYGRYLPIWGFTELPYGKGSVYLSHVAAKSAEELAVTQLKGLKLGVWALILYGVLLLNFKFDDHFGVPTMHEAIAYYAQGNHFSMPWAWLVVLDKFFRAMLELTVMGHFIVATCRMCGFRILRNTYRPLQSPTIAEFWNRYNFYFKELLAEFFFYPTYFVFFKKNPKLRLFFATMSAATFGNMLFHFQLMTPIIITDGLGTALKNFSVFTFYAVVLGIGIACSQLHNRHTAELNKEVKYKFLSPIVVLGFYALLGIFNSTAQTVGISNNFKLLGSLFFITW
jgi:Ca2+/Na+ antiporter